MGSHQSHTMGSDEWLTPRHILDALGTFDLDPCGAPETSLWPTARRHYRLPDDGLTRPWSGRVWLNPPYGKRVWLWMERLAVHGKGTALTFARTETAGFVEYIWRRADAIMFLHGRLHFHYPDGTRAAANAGAPSCLVAYGSDDVAALMGSGLAGTLVTTWMQIPCPPGRSR